MAVSAVELQWADEAECKSVDAVDKSPVVSDNKVAALVVAA